MAGAGFKEEGGLTLEPEPGVRQFDSNLQKLLIESSTNGCETQKEKLENEFLNWKGDLEQVDDVCIIGIKNYTVAIPNRYLFIDAEPINEYQILLPEIVIENIDENGKTNALVEIIDKPRKIY